MYVYVCYHWHCKTSHLTDSHPHTCMGKKLNLLLLLAVVKQCPGIVPFVSVYLCGSECVCGCFVSCIFLLAQVNCSACVALSLRLSAVQYPLPLCLCLLIYVLSVPILPPRHAPCLYCCHSLYAGVVAVATCLPIAH